jgi:hypothetical protein
MTARKQAPAKPVANLADAKKAQAAMRQAEAEAKQRHPSARQRPAAKPAAKKPAPAKTEATKVVYAATGTGGVERRTTTTAKIAWAVEACISGRRASHMSKGTVIAFYSDRAKADAAAATINSGGAGPDWSNARVIEAKAVAS